MDGKTVRKFGIGASLDFNSLPVYLRRRGYTFEEMAEAGVVGSKNGRYFDALGGRLIIPVINHMNQVVAFCGRILEDKASQNTSTPGKRRCFPRGTRFSTSTI